MIIFFILFFSFIISWGIKSRLQENYYKEVEGSYKVKYLTEEKKIDVSVNLVCPARNKGTQAGTSTPTDDFESIHAFYVHPITGEKKDLEVRKNTWSANFDIDQEETDVHDEFHDCTAEQTEPKNIDSYKTRYGRKIRKPTGLFALAFITAEIIEGNFGHSFGQNV